MKQAKLTRAFDYRKRAGKMYSYPAGFDGEMPDEHYDAAVAQGVVEGAKAPKADATAPDKGTTAPATK
jgi:hypothetical protein